MAAEDTGKGEGENANSAPTSLAKGKKRDAAGSTENTGGIPPTLDDKPLSASEQIEAPAELVSFRSRDASFALCMRLPRTKEVDGHVVERLPGKYIYFHQYGYNTKNPEEIAFLRRFMKGNYISSNMVFEMPKVDELLMGNVTERIDEMPEARLIAECQNRSIIIDGKDNADTMRYKLLKKLVGTEKGKTSK
jgi:hypothetical protein